MKKQLEKFMLKTIDGSDGCIEWAKSCNRQRYGQVKFLGKVLKAHRLSWILNFGNIPDGLCVLHSCDNPPCINPNHLFLGTNADNMADKVAKGRQSRNEYETSRIQCPQGHPYNEENTYLRGTNRICKTCRRDYMRARRAMSA